MNKTRADDRDQIQKCLRCHQLETAHFPGGWRGTGSVNPAKPCPAFSRIAKKRQPSWGRNL